MIFKWMTDIQKIFNHVNCLINKNNLCNGLIVIYQNKYHNNTNNNNITMMVIYLAYNEVI